MPSLATRLWQYQAERFPLATHLPLVAAFSSSVVCYSRKARGLSGWPPWTSLAVAFIGSLCFFLLLRITDEHKDLAEDAAYRPYRAVPRGLVTLKELRCLALAAAFCQFAADLAYWPPLILLAVGVWIYLGCMTEEFFARKWLKAHPMAYLFSHMLILPFVDFFVSACDWMPTRSAPPLALIGFLMLSFANGLTLEFGRKIRAPEQEEKGVETYSALYGIPRATLGWLVSWALAAACALWTAAQVGNALPMAALVLLFGALLVATGITMARRPSLKVSKVVEMGSGIWTLCVYLVAGILPVILEHRP